MVQDKKAEAEGRGPGGRQDITQERARRRAAEVADEEDSGFLRQRMEAVLEEEKAQLAQETASLLQENRPLASEEVGAPGRLAWGPPPRG